MYRFSGCIHIIIPVFICLIFLPGRVTAQAGPEYTGISTLPDTSAIAADIRSAIILREQQPEKAGAIFTETLEQSRHIGYASGIIQSLTELGYLNTNKGNAALALHQFGIASGYPVRPVYRGYIYNGIANVYNFTGRYKEALALYLQALRLVQSAPDNSVIPAVNIQYNIATILFYIKEYKKSLAYTDQILSEDPEYLNTQKKLYGNLLNIKSSCYYRLKEDPAYSQRYLDSFLVYSDAAIHYARNHHLPSLLTLALTNRILIFLEEKQPEKITEELMELKTLEQEHHLSLNIETGTYRAIANAFMESGEIRKAEKYFLMALEKSNGQPKEQLYIYKPLAAYYHQRGKNDLAYQYQKAYQTLSDSIAGKETAIAVNELETKYRTAEKDREITQKQLVISNQEKKIAQKNLWIFSGFTAAAIIALIAVWRQVLLRHRSKLRDLQLQITGEEKERKRLAQELHDGINSQISGINSYLYTLRDEIPDVDKNDTFHTILATVHNTSADIRKVAHNMLPLSFEERNLADSIGHFINSVTAGKNIETDFQIYGDCTHLDKNLALNIYRIIQELLHNIIKHASATQVIILIDITDHTINLTIEDNGRGFDADNIREGAGLANIKSRVKAHNGNLTLESSPGKGTIVAITFPE